MTIASIVAQSWWSIIQDHRLTLDAELENGLVAVRLLEEQATQTLRDAQVKLDAVATAVKEIDNEKTSHESDIRKVVALGLQHNGNLNALQLINMKGQSRITSLDYPRNQADFSDRKYVRFLITRPDFHQVVVGRPFQNRDDDQWVVPLASNLYDKTGRRVGLVGTDIRLSNFDHFHARVAKESNAIVSLIADEGYVIVRSPFEARYEGRDVSALPIFRQLHDGAIEGSLIDGSFLDDQLPRAYSYRKMDGYPITVVYGAAVGEITSAWRVRSKDRILFSGITISLIALLAFVLLQHVRRLYHSEGRLVASEMRYRMLYESADDGICLINRDQVYVDCNPAAIRMFDVSSKEHIIGKKIGNFSPSSQTCVDPRLDKTLLIEAAFKGEPQLFEWATLRQGKLRYNEITLSRANVDHEVLLLAVFRDITARKTVEAMHAGQNQISHMIGTGRELQEILSEIVRFVELRSPQGRCMIFMVSDDQSHFTWGVAPTLPEKLLHTMNGMKIKPGDGAYSEAILTKCPVMVDDMSANPLMSGIGEQIASASFGACGSWPIMGKQGHILGVFSIIYRAGDTPTADDLQLVGISTDLASIAIESRRSEEKVLRLAHYDDLTGLPNRFLYMQHLQKALAHADRNHLPLGVLFLDLDRFKSINDTFGHEQGDAVLRDVASRFRICLRESDIIGRVGGDEFVILVDDYRDPLELGEVAHKLLVQAAQPFEIDGQECQLSASIGIATFPADGATAQELVKNADIAMYRAKTTGKDNYQFYSSEMNAHTVDRMALETKLRRAIERREFVIHYQPKVELKSGRIAGAEGLIRWNHPERGLLYPGEFIALAEDAGLIGQLGMLALDIACRDIASFARAGISFGRVAINLSAGQFNDGNLLRDVERVVAIHGTASTSLEFEITESMVMNNRDSAIDLMDGIRDSGFSLSIDDFGTGYSSLAYLKRFPVDSVKVDKSFINDIPYDLNDSAIVQAIIVMAHTLGLKVTAEGVETTIQLETLRSFGCDEYQGYLYSKAIPVADFIDLVRQQIPVSSS